MINALVQNITAWDTSITLRMFGWKRLRLLDGIMIGASRLGDGYFYVLLGFLAWMLDPKAAPRFLASGAIGFAIELPLHILLKNTTRRNRPFHRLPQISRRIHPPDKFSFPSGHTAGAFLMASVVAASFPLLAIPSVIAAILIGFSRIYNGVHFTTDVLAGMVLGVLCAHIGITIIY